MLTCTSAVYNLRRVTLILCFELITDVIIWTQQKMNFWFLNALYVLCVFVFLKICSYAMNTFYKRYFKIKNQINKINTAKKFCKWVREVTHQHLYAHIFYFKPIHIISLLVEFSDRVREINSKCTESKSWYSKL